MGELHNFTEVAEVKTSETNRFGEISSELKEAFNEAKSFVREIFGQTDEHYVSYEDRLSRAPVDSERGEWSGEPGESKFIPSGTTELSVAAKEKLTEYGMDGVEYRDAEPDFSKCSEETVKIDHMTDLRYDNFNQADMKCAEQWNATQKDRRDNWTPQEVSDWRHEHNCSWHECCDTKTMQLVPREIHEFFNHSGGVAECRARDAANNGGGFDE